MALFLFKNILSVFWFLLTVSVRMRLQFTHICPCKVPGCQKSMRSQYCLSYVCRSPDYSIIHQSSSQWTRIFHRSAVWVLTDMVHSLRSRRVPFPLRNAGSCVCNPVSHTHLQTGDSPLTPPAVGLQCPAVCHTLHVQVESRFVCLAPFLKTCFAPLNCYVAAKMFWAVATILLGGC